MDKDDNDFRDARRALEDEEFLRARDLLYQHAVGGNTHAQYFLARACRGMSSNSEFNSEMLRWYSEAAAHGHAEAAFDLACILDPNVRENVDVIAISMKDDAKSKSLYCQAFRGFLELAQQGDAESQSMLGVIYLCGLGISADVSMAIHWFSESFRNGYKGAANNLCSIYYGKSNATKHDRASALYWYEQTKSAGCQCIHIPEFD